jgi:CheY-like chemotaxis protein
MRHEPETVFLVEDDPASRRLVRAVLKPRGYRLSEAGAFQEAKDFLAEVVPALVLLDLRLPDGSGVELLHHIRTQQHLKGIPVVALTAQAMKGEEARCRKAGFDEFLPKPVDTRRLRAIVDDAVNKRREHVG